MTRRTVTVQLDRRSATVSGPRIHVALDRSGARWHWHPNHHRAVSVHLAELDDVLAALEMDGQHVEVVDRNGDVLPFGGLFGWDPARANWRGLEAGR